MASNGCAAASPTNHNPFYYYDKSIISIDTLKQDAEYRTYLEQTRWDIIVIDEAHNVADRGTSSLRSRLAKRLSKCSDTLIMLSATPHDGRARSFASLVNMLDATAIADPDDYTKEDFRPGLVIRRFKKDVQAQVRTAFRDREVHPQRFDASATEETAYEALLAVPTASERTTRNRDLFHVTLEKALFSSPAACLETLDERLKKRQQEIGDGDVPDAVAAEVAALQELREALDKITPANYAKYQALLAAIRDGQPFQWTPDTAEDRLVIFTERIATLNWLRTRLAEDLALKRDQIDILHGGLSDIEQQRVVEDFGNAVRPVRLLLLLGRRRRGHQPALSMPPPHSLRHALVADGLPAAQWPGGPLRPNRHAANRLSRLPERQSHHPGRYQNFGGADGKGRASVQEHRRPVGVHGRL